MATIVRKRPVRRPKPPVLLDIPLPALILDPGNKPGFAIVDAEGILYASASFHELKLTGPEHAARYSFGAPVRLASAVSEKMFLAHRTGNHALAMHAGFQLGWLAKSLDLPAYVVSVVDWRNSWWPRSSTVTKKTFHARLRHFHPKTEWHPDPNAMDAQAIGLSILRGVKGELVTF